MAEKVLFEYQAKKEENGYHYEFHHGDQHVEINSSMPLRGFGHGPFGPMHACRAKLRHSRWSRKAARKALNKLERLYQDLYGGEVETYNAGEGVGE